MTFKIDPDMEWFLQQFGQPEVSEPPGDATLRHYQGKLPSRLLEYWQEFGFCTFQGGLISIVNPADYDGALQTWLKGTSVSRLDTFHVIARSGFGDLYLWGEKTGQSWNIEPMNGRLFNNGSKEKEIAAGEGNDQIEAFFGVIDPGYVDAIDTGTRKPIFRDAVKRFGPLEPQEMFTFEPAPFLGGEKSLASIAKVNFFVQSEVLAALGNRDIMDMKGLARKAFT